ncbi:MAG TPA: YceI family protein [Puia sp.]|jgi:polyisoprenoid-binding protein YceI
MKAYLLHVLILVAAGDVSAQIKPIDNKSTIDFSIRNFGIRVSGTFKGMEGDIHFDPAHLDQANFDIGLDANSVNTDNSLRDDHLRGESFLDVKHYPRIRLVSTRVLPSNKKDIWFFYGKLTIKGHEKDISFPFSATASMGGYLFKGAFKIKRKDFEVGGTSTISDEMDVSLSVFAN